MVALRVACSGLLVSLTGLNSKYALPRVMVEALTLTFIIDWPTASIESYKLYLKQVTITPGRNDFLLWVDDQISERPNLEMHSIVEAGRTSGGFSRKVHPEVDCINRH